MSVGRRMSSKSSPKKNSKKVLVLDLETLVHSTMTRLPNYSYKISKERTINFYVTERPYVKEFLNVVTKWYYVVIMTASLKTYADPIIDRLSKYGKIERRYYRPDCLNVNGLYVKDLETIAKECKKGINEVLIVDNSPISYAKQPENAIPITSWYNDMKDEELLDTIQLLDALRFVEDVRSILQNQQFS